MGLPLDRELVLHLLEEIEIVLTAHQIWLKRFNQALLFDGAALAENDKPDAYLYSSFGEWYYSTGLDHITQHPEFIEVGKIQKEMHEAAKRLCTDRRQFSRMQEEDYDLCMSLSVHLNTLLRSLQMDIVGELMTTDPLTGCFGRRGMLEKLKGEQDRAVRLGKTACIVLMDFDHFKQINDTLGHSAGDAALRQGIRFILSHLRKYDSLFRYGGEEFLACLPDTPMPDAINIVERLRAGLEKLEILPQEGAPFSVTASFGLVELLESRSVDQSIAAADHALYRAKQGGRNWVEVESTPEIRLIEANGLSGFPLIAQAC